MDKRTTLTTAAGIPVADNQNALSAGPRGPLLVQDWQLFEKHAHFNRERIPERVVHAKGLTKVWPHRDYPLIEVGVLELNRNPENYFAEVEQAAFTPAHVVPGIGHSPDKMLQFRIFSYGVARALGISTQPSELTAQRKAA